MAGVVKIAQVVVAELVAPPPQTLRPVAIEVLVVAQLVGAR
jgi:hypothetical protein